MDVPAHVITIATRAAKATAAPVVTQCARADAMVLARAHALRAVWVLALILVWVIVMVTPNSNPNFAV